MVPSIVPNPRWHAPTYIREMVCCSPLSNVFRILSEQCIGSGCLLDAGRFSSFMQFSWNMNVLSVQVENHNQKVDHCLVWYDHTPYVSTLECYTVKPVLAVTSIKQPTCFKQPNKMFPNVKFVLIFTSVKQPPALSSHFLCFPCVAA